MRCKHGMSLTIPCHECVTELSEKLLHLTLKKKWFDMILRGEKKEEYRALKLYWITRLLNEDKEYTHIKFRNGYSKSAPWMIVELKEIVTGYGKPSLGCPVSECIILKLGNVTASKPETAPPPVDGHVLSAPPSSVL